MAIGQSTAIGAGPKLTRLIEVVIESMQVVPIAVSCCNHVDVRDVVAALTRRSGVDVLPWGKSIMIWGALLSFKD